jgi:hypothetical protein
MPTIDETIVNLKPLSERKEMLAQYGMTKLPYQDLCEATFTISEGQTLIVDVISINEDETQAILSYKEEGGKRAIWHAYRDQQGQPGTWLWTAEQLEAARHNPIRIDEKENDFEDDEAATTPIEIAPLHPNRRTEILILGLYLQKTDAEVQERLRTEGFSDVLPTEYREPGELMSLLESKLTLGTGKFENPGIRSIEPLKAVKEEQPKENRLTPSKPIKFSGKKKHR